MTELTRKKVSFLWFDGYEASFLKIINLLTSSPIISFPVEEKGFTMYYEALGVGLVCAGSIQKGVIAYALRQLKVSTASTSLITWT